ncbi:exonuclease SbcCD subunit D [Selenomonas sp. F0473]|uniref:exonuclease SbcCD subunit D n=1 Tax=Selenomonas sp. F0473 TaxID=999423 RepID=UPI00029E6126|nr:exonuclease SbcCD subunit D [Selenomonas sp. F0473]EKU71710.1 exonuclease SbcCD, D subunit [Selenomonas sp. F0473]
MRFIHTADWHLGKLFGQRHMTEDQAYVLDELLALCADVRPDALVIAGDVYDRAIPPPEAVALFSETLAKLAARNIKALFIAGNHDSAVRLGFGAELLRASGVYPAGTVRAAQPPVVLSDAYGDVYFSLIPYGDPPHVKEAFALESMPSFDAALGVQIAAARAQIPAGARSVAVAHAFVVGGQPSESEHALSVGGSDQVRTENFAAYNYTALGHLHAPQRAGAEHIRYSGSLLKYSFDEARQKKGVELVDIDGAGAVSHAFYPLAPRHDVRIVSGLMTELLSEGFDPLPHDDYICAELLDSDAVLAAHEKLRQIYPNLFSITRPNINMGRLSSNERTYERGQSDFRLFADFFADVTKEEMSPEEERALSRVIDDLEREERAE